MSRLAVVFLCGFGACAAWCDVVEADGRVTWRSDVAEGSYADAANWTGGVTPMDAGKYGVVSFQDRDVTLTVPEEGLVDSSGTVFLGTGAGDHALTIDTRGTWWEKRGVVSAQHWWGTPFAMNLTGSHVFNFENAPTAANVSFYWRFDDALFTWRSQGAEKQDFDLRSGTFSFGNNLYYGSIGGTVDFFIHPDAKMDAPGKFVQRGNGTTRTTFLGGRHRVRGIVLKDTNSGAGRTWLVLTNDAYLASSDSMDLGARGTAANDGRSSGVVELYGTSRLDVTNGVFLGAGSTKPELVNFRNEGEVWVRDSATFYANAAVVMGATQCSTGLVTVADNATFTTRPKGDSVRLGAASNAVGRLVVEGDGTFTCGGVLSLGFSGVHAKGYVTLKDRAQASCGTFNGTWIQMARSGDGAMARLEIFDDATLRLGSGSSVEMTMGGTSRAEVALAGNGRLLGSASSFITNRSEHAGCTSLSIVDDALVSLKSIHGAAPGTGEPAMTFVADGGTLALSTATPNVPYLSGCVATLGVGGLTFEASAADMEIDQSFTAAEGAVNAAVRKTGLGALVVRRNSSHPKTVVAEGALCFAGGATRFGNVLEIAQGARLALRDASAAIEADSISFAGDLNVDLPSDLSVDATHPVLRLATPLTDEQFARVVVANPATGRNYEWALSDDRTELSVSVAEATPGALAWTGAVGADWHDTGNWDPAAVPTHNDVATVGRGAEIAVGASAAVGTLAVTAADAVAVSGEGPLYVGAGVDVAADGSAELSVPLRCADGAIAKTGSGTLTVSGDNAGTLFAGWSMAGGVTAFASAAALGADTDLEDALALSNCTFRYSGEAATVVRPWRLDGEFPCIFDISGDLTFDQFRISFAQGDAGVVKTGAGVLTLDVPAGTTTLSTYKNAVRGGNKDVSGTFAPARGEVSGWNGAGQFTILDGALEIRGEGKGLTTVRQEHHALLGGAGWTQTVPAELRLKDVTFVQGSGNGFHMLMDGEVPAGNLGSRLLLEDADMTCNGLYVGYSRTGTSDVLSRPVLSITNGTLNATWNLEIPHGGNFAPVVRVGRGGTLMRSSPTAAGGVTFNHALDARFEDGGLLKVAAPQNLFFGWNATGEVVFARGGGMAVNRFLAQNGDRAAVCAFDGGFAEFTLDGGVSCADRPAKMGLRADAGGCELRVGAGVEHALAMSLQGDGVFTKTGAGTLVLTNDLSVKMVDNLPVYTPKGTQTVLVANAGGVVIAEGALRCVAGTTDANSRFSGTGVLSGDFTTLTLAVEPGAAEALTFEGVTAERVVADFGRADDDPVRSGTTAAVARVATAEAFGAMAWKGVNAGANVSASFAYDADTGLVTATLRRGGMAVIFR